MAMLSLVDGARTRLGHARLAALLLLLERLELPLQQAEGVGEAEQVRLLRDHGVAVPQELVADERARQRLVATRVAEQSCQGVGDAPHRAVGGELEREGVHRARCAAILAARAVAIAATLEGRLARLAWLGVRGWG